MRKARTGRSDEDDIVTPSANDKATDRGGAGLRMPPIIDMSPSVLQRLYDAVLGVLRGTLYQTSLIALLLMALGLMVLTLMQAGNIKTPDWSLQWPFNGSLNSSLNSSRGTDSKDGTDAAAHAPKTPATVTPPTLDGPIVTPAETPTPAFERDAAIAPGPVSQTPPLRAQGQPAQQPAQPLSDLLLETAPAANPDLQAEIAALRQTLADTRRDLATAEAALLAKQASTGRADIVQLTRRATLAELLLRLDDGVAFDDLLDGGQLDDVLTTGELAALALHAARGVPTEAGILAQAETLPLIIGQGGADAASPDALPALFGWLADKAPKLIRIRQTPMAGAQEQWRALYAELHARDWRAAMARTRLLVLSYDTDTNGQSEVAQALQALYADLRAFSETRTLRTDLRRDYMAGVRP